MSDAISESANGSQTEDNGEAGVAANAATAQAAPPSQNSRLHSVLQFLWLSEKIADAKEQYLNPSQPGWREFELARETQGAIEEIKESGDNPYAQALLLRVQLLATIRCVLRRSGSSIDEDRFSITDWQSVRAIPEIEKLCQNLSAVNLKHLENVLGEHAERYLMGLGPAQRQELLVPLKEIASSLIAPLEREAEAVNRLKIARYFRVVSVAAVLFVALALAFGWFADKSGHTNLAFNKTVTVTSQIPGVGTDHRQLVDGDRTNIGFHTDSLPNQSAVIDLGQSMKFDKVVVYNRADCCKERAVPMQIEVSDDNKTYKKLAERTDEFDVWTASMLRAKGRYLRLRLLKSNPFHLSEVEVY